jgi:hypothetical protein
MIGVMSVLRSFLRMTRDGIESYVEYRAAVSTAQWRNPDDESAATAG